MSSWILPRVTHSSWMKSLPFTHWVCNTSMTHLHWPFKYAYAGMLLSSSTCMMMSSCLTCTLPEPGCCVQNLGLTRNTWLIRMLMRLTGKKFLPPSFMWPRTRLIPTQERTSQSLPLVTLKKVTVQVKLSRMNLPLHWLQIRNSMLMQAAYTEVGRDFIDKGAFSGSEYHKLRRLELVPQRWPLARLSIPLQKSVDHLDRVLAGCC